MTSVPICPFSHFRLVVNGEEFEARRFPFDSVYFLTHAYSISGEAIRWLWSANVSLFVIDWHGFLHKGAFKPRLRLAQYEAWAGLRQQF